MGRLKKGKDFVKMAELQQCQYAFVCKRDKTNIVKLYINEHFCFILVIFGARSWRFDFPHTGLFRF